MAQPRLSVHHPQTLRLRRVAPTEATPRHTASTLEQVVQPSARRGLIRVADKLRLTEACLPYLPEPTVTFLSPPPSRTPCRNSLRRRGWAWRNRSTATEFDFPTKSVSLIPTPRSYTEVRTTCRPYGPCLEFGKYYYYSTPYIYSICASKPIIQSLFEPKHNTLGWSH